MSREDRCSGGCLRQGGALALVLGQETKQQGVQGAADRGVPQAGQVQVVIHVMVTYGAVGVHKARVCI